MSRSRLPVLRQTAPVHFHWKKIKVYVVLYKSSSGNEILIKSLRRPPRVQVLRGPKGRKKFTAVTPIKPQYREVIIVAKTAAASKKKRSAPEVDEAELEALAALEELEEEDEDVEEPEEVDEDDEDEDEDEEPAPKRSSKKTKAAKTRGSRAASEGKIGTQEIATAAGVDSRTLRMVLRKHAIEKDEESGRYQWDSMKDKTVVKIMKLLKAGAADDIKQEALDKLKAAQEAKKAAKNGTKGKGKVKKTKKTVVVEDDDEDDDDE